MVQTEASRINRCETQLKDFLSEALRDVGPERLGRRTAPDKWSALENLAHLGRYHEVFLERLARMLAENSPTFDRYRAEDDPQWESWRALDPAQIFARLRTLREQLVDKLKQLDEAAFSRIGTHPKFGKMTVSLWIEFFLVHEAHHLYLVLGQVRGDLPHNFRPA